MFHSKVCDVCNSVHNIMECYVFLQFRFAASKVYDFLIVQKEEQFLSRLYYQKNFNDTHLNWKNIFFLVRIVTKHSKLYAFQFRLINNVLYLNRMLLNFGKSDSPLYYFCCLKDDSPYHLFYEIFTFFDVTIIKGYQNLLFQFVLQSFFLMFCNN